MAPRTYSFSTGPSPLPDVGELEYNACRFSPLFTTQVSGVAVKDEAQRTVKYMEYTIKVDGYVTMRDGYTDIDPTMARMRKLLSDQGGALKYKGRGCDIAVNNGSDLDVAWGPVPEVLEFQPLGAGRSAKIVWQCKVRVNEQKKFIAQSIKPPPPPIIVDGTKPGTRPPTPVAGGLIKYMLQFSYGSTVTYSEDGYSKLDVSGVLEIPLTRIPNQKTRTLQQTADDLRTEIDARIMNGIDLNKFRVTNRRFSLSSDKRTLEWQVMAEEIPYQQMPADCTLANGTYSIRPAKTGPGLVRWLCNLRATYTVRADKPRRTAWLAFITLMRHRMLFGGFIRIEPEDGPKPEKYFVSSKKKRAVMLVDFNIDEGLYLDSKTITFSATWTLVSLFEDILLKSGVWRKLEEKAPGAKDNLWAISMKNVEGSQSWLRNKANAEDDIIVDFGM